MQSKGLSRVEAINRILQKMIKQKGSPVQFPNNAISDQETYSKLRKQSGLTHEDVIKTMQLKKEIDFIIESKLYQESGSGSSEESLEHSHQYSEGQLSPNSLEKVRTEKRYLKKYKRAFDTVIDRVENQSSSGNNSGDERHNKTS
jgi:hypothetical protein